MKRQSISKLAEDVATGTKSAEQLVQQSLKRAQEHSDYAALLEINSVALAKAKKLDQEVKKGRTGRLLGVPFVAKDNFLTFDTQTTAASNILKGFRAPYQAA